MTKFNLNTIQVPMHSSLVVKGESSPNNNHSKASKSNSSGKLHPHNVSFSEKNEQDSIKSPEPLPSLPEAIEQEKETSGKHEGHLDSNNDHKKVLSESNRKKKFIRFSLASNFDSTSGVDNVSATAKTNKTDWIKGEDRFKRRKTKRTVSMDEIKQQSDHKIEATSMEPLSDIDEPETLEEASNCKNPPESNHSELEEDLKDSEPKGISPNHTILKIGARSECQSLSGIISGEEIALLKEKQLDTTCSNKNIRKAFKPDRRQKGEKVAKEKEKDDLRNMVLMVLKGEALRQIPKSLKNDMELVNAYKDYIKNALKSS